MTTATRPLPPHGSYARANGCPGYRKPCKCEPCHQTLRRARKKYNVNRQLGQPGLVDATPARRRLQQLQTTMTWQQICAATGCDDGNLRLIIDGQRTQIRRATLTGILSVQPQPPAPGKYLDATGTRRRIQALRALGYSAQAIAEAAGSADSRIQLIASGGQPTVRESLAAKIRRVYGELSQKPAPTGRSATRAKNHAAAHQWALPAAWDDDGIDDPAALPDWTGCCGTDRGWWTHNINRIPVCPRCQEAHDAWLAERKHLRPAERFRQLALAKGEASNRGTNLAHDARELMHVSGLTVEQAAERLGVTVNHLQHELARHPDTEKEAA